MHLKNYLHYCFMSNWNQHSRRFFWLIACLLATVFTVGEARSQRYPFYNLNVESGLIQSQPRVLLQDRLGHLWIGTLGGLSRYDGQKFTNFSTRNGMLSNAVYALATDSRGLIWLGGTDGISSFDGRTFRHYATRDTGAATVVTQISIDSNNTLWFLRGSKIFQLKNGKAIPFATPDRNALITSLFVEDETLWCSKMGGGVYRYGGGKWDSLTANLPGLFITQIYRDQKNRMWFPSNYGLLTVDSGRLRLADLPVQPVVSQLPVMLSITEDRTGALWIGTASGVLRIADSSLQVFNKRSGLSDNPFRDMLLDAEGNIWMASDGQGIFRYSGTQFTVIDESTGLGSGQVTSFERVGNRLYLGTYDAGLYFYENGLVEPLHLPLQNPPVITSLQYRNGSLWIGTRGAGLWRYNGTFFYSYLPENGKVLSNTIATQYLDRQGRLWIGFSNGAMLYNGRTFETVLDRVLVQDFIQLNDDTIFIATSKGIQLYANGTVYPFVTGTRLDSASTQCFTLRGRELWAGTSDDGIIVYHLDKKTTVPINQSNGLQSDFIYNIVVDNSGDVWAGTGYGIHRITLKDGSEPSVYFYGKGHGMRGMESNHNAVLKMPDGSIWFGTTNGALHYKPQTKLTEPQPTSIVLQSVKLLGEANLHKDWFDSTDVWYQVPYGLSLPYKKNNLSFTFQAISLSSNEQIRYRYRIDGLDAPWSDWSQANTVTLSALPPGKYTLRVQSIAWGSALEPKELAYPFEIITPFHKTNWFRLLVLLGCILLGISLQYLVNLRKQNRIKLLERLRREEQNKVRQRTAEDFHDEVGNRLTRINVLTNVLKSKIGNPTPETDRIIEKIQENTTQLYSGTRDILWSLKPSNDNLYEILHRIRDFAIELYQDTEVDFKFIGTDERWKNHILPLDVSRNLIMIFKEALNNSLKYSNAKKVKLEAWLRGDNVLQLILMDYGDGFDLHYVKKGHGIENMHTRAKRINGRLYIDSQKGKGTIITLTFRIPRDQFEHKLP